jgi:Domain of unknown function (DUF4389)
MDDIRPERYVAHMDTAVPAAVPSPRHPVRLRVDDDLRRSRLTVFFRLLLAIPHFIVLMLFLVVAVVLLPIHWLITLIAGRPVGALHAFYARTLRYTTQVTAYLHLLANPFPPFGGGSPYPVDLEIGEPDAQNRLVTFFRLILAIPAYLLASVLAYVLQIVAFLGWFVCLILGRMPEGMRNLGAYCLRFQMQTYAYILLVTSRYPSLSFPKTE